MSITLRKARWAGSLGALFTRSSLVCSSLVCSLVALPACSGSDSSDDPLDGEPLDESTETSDAPAAPSSGSNDADPSTPSATDEDGPNVTDLDESTAPDGEGSAGDGDSEEEPDGDDGMEAGGMSVTPIDSVDVPGTDLCAAVADWDPAWVQFEEEVLLLVNEARSQPADCGVEGQFEAAAPLTMNPVLRCSARLHSLDMFERDFFAHDTPDGIDPFQRMAEAGFVGSGGGENIALGQRDPEEVMQAWMESDGHCANVMRANFDTIGVGYHPGAGQRGLASNYWTQNFGAPPFMRGGNRR